MRWGKSGEQAGQAETLPFLWTRLQRETRPLVLYGMGNGADKILRKCREYGLRIAAVFASNGFVRGQSYQGFPVRTLAQVEVEWEDFVVLLGFASQRPEVLEDIRRVAERHTLLVPDLPVCGEEILTPEILERRSPEIEQLKELLADDSSRQVLEDVLRYKLTGEPDFLWRCETAREEVFREILAFGPDEVYVDAGAYNGDTVEEFIWLTGDRYRRILAIEPDRRNYRKLEAVAKRLDPERIRCIHGAIWSGPDTRPFNDASGRQASLSEDGTGVAVRLDSVDNLLAGGPATYIKYDVEGAEREALLGSTETIRNHRPKLAVAVYHRGEDLLDLPLLVHRLCPEYRLYLRHHPYLPAWETNLYAI